MKVLKVRFFVLEKTTLLMGFSMQRQLKLNEEVNGNLAVKREEGFIRSHVLNWITVSIEKNLNQLIMINGLKSSVIPVQFENDYSFE